MGKIQTLETGLSFLWKRGKSISKDKINPKTLGYVCPNGNVNFATEDAAFDYAKNCVMKALKSEKPYERGLAIKGSTITTDIHGTKNGVNFNGQNLTDAIVLHGHPYDTPISIGDAPLLLKYKMKKIIAFNNNGEYSSLTNILKMPKWHKILPKFITPVFQKSYLKSKLIQLKESVDKISETVVYEAFHKEKGMIALKEECKNIYENADEKTKRIIDNWVMDAKKDVIADTSVIPAEIRPFFDNINKLQINANLMECRLAHNLWSERAKDFGMMYETNYSDDLIKSWNI